MTERFIAAGSSPELARRQPACGRSKIPPFANEWTWAVTVADLLRRATGPLRPFAPDYGAGQFESDSTRDVTQATIGVAELAARFWDSGIESC